MNKVDVGHNSMQLNIAELSFTHRKALPSFSSLPMIFIRHMI